MSNTGTETAATESRPGRLRRLVAAVGRGLRAIFRPVVIVTVAAVVAAGALVVVAVEQRDQTDWQRRQRPHRGRIWQPIRLSPVQGDRDR